MIAILFIVCYVSLVSSHCGYDEKEYHRRLQNVFHEEFVNQNEAKAAWVGVNHPQYGDLYWTFGDAVVGKVPATIHDHFYIGSISKTFGATVNIILSEKGYFSLDDTIGDIVPEFTDEFPEYRDYTVTDLLRMQTLVPDFLNQKDGLLSDLLENPKKRYTIEEVVEFALRDGLSPDVGIGQYSSTNFLVMEYIAEKVTGCPMPRLVKDYILEPLHLRRTAEPSRFSYGTLPSPKPRFYAGSACVGEYNDTGAVGMIKEGEDVSDEADLIVVAGTAGSIYSTIQELLQWAKSGTGDYLLSRESRNKRHQRLPVSLVGYYGLGQYLYLDLGEGVTGNWSGHAGDAFGSTAFAFKNNELHASFASGLSTCGYTGLMRKFLSIYEEDLRANPPDQRPCYDEPVWHGKRYDHDDTRYRNKGKKKGKRRHMA